ncbi:hypothetical protein AB6A40_002135 [Gnathostoma spinigerum]|uniref:Globin domain-containing protein n=1 Tax=Gnathostoma spinigerum TaxID=75299 RepID=A0ABD6E744_9BILA
MSVKDLCRKSLDVLKIGQCDKSYSDGKDFYAHLIGNHPDLRHYFKGAENFTADDVRKSDRFKKQGQSLLLSVFVLVETYDDKPVFLAYARELVDRHHRDNVHLKKELWNIFWTVFVSFLKEKSKVDDATEKAWLQLGKDFSDECLRHLKEIGAPEA